MQTTPLQKDLPRNIQLRLLVSIPVTLAAFTLGSGFLALSLAQNIHLPALLPKDLLTIAGAVLLMTAAASISGIMLAYGITNPLKRLTMRVESLIRERESDKEWREITAPNELGILTALFDRAFISINELVSDSHILQRLPDAVITINPQGEIADLNRTAARFLGSDPQPLKGKPIREVFTPSEENGPFFHLLDEGWKGKRVLFQPLSLSLPGKKIDPVWVEISPSGGERSGEITVLFKDPGEIKTIRNYIRKTEQLALLGALASGIAHEVRNPLGSLRALTELISEELPSEDRKRLYTENILKEIDRLNHLVEDILDFARNPLARIEPTDIDQILSQTISLAQYNFPEKEVEVIREQQPDLSLLQADAERLTQAFLNLLINAFEATPAGGKIEIRSRAPEVRTVTITIADQGPGIVPEDLSRIFDPFYTTKEKGTGLGLAIAQHIITAHGGEIQAESAPGQGARFRVVLPVQAPLSPA